MPQPAGIPGDTSAGAGEAGTGEASESESGSDAPAGTEPAGGAAGDGEEQATGAGGGPAATDAPGDDGWVTSNEIPGAGQSDMPPMPGARQGGSQGSGKDGILDKALEGLDGEILSERAVIRSRSNETAASGGAGASGPGADPDSSVNGSVASAAKAPAMPGVPTNRTNPPGPRAVSTGPVPEDIPLAAQDDDIIARQLREAAMQEPDPELREKLWAEYRRYKGL